MFTTAYVYGFAGSYHRLITNKRCSLCSVCVKMPA